MPVRSLLAHREHTGSTPEVHILNRLFQIPSSYWDPLWNFCNADGDAEVTSGELTQCGAKAAAWAGMSDSTQTFLYNFAAKYWNTVDQNQSGSLDYDEFR